MRRETAVPSASGRGMLVSSCRETRLGPGAGSAQDLGLDGAQVGGGVWLLRPMGRSWGETAPRGVA